jgi:hypothetical protein
MHDHDRRESLRRRVAAALRRARGEFTQAEFCRLLGPALGSEPAADQWGRYELGKVDPPAVVLLAAAEVSGHTVAELMDEPSTAGDEIRQTLSHMQGLLEQALDGDRLSSPPGSRAR